MLLVATAIPAGCVVNTADLGGPPPSTVGDSQSDPPGSSSTADESAGSGTDGGASDPSATSTQEPSDPGSTGSTGFETESSTGLLASDPYIGLGGVDVEPDENADAIRETILETKEDLQECYSIALKEDPTLRGRLTAALQIDADGAVLDVTIVVLQLDDPAIGSCFSDHFSTLVFELPSAQATTATIPFQLYPE